MILTTVWKPLAIAWSLKFLFSQMRIITEQTLGFCENLMVVGKERSCNMPDTFWLLNLSSDDDDEDDDTGSNDDVSGFIYTPVRYA